MSYQDVATAGGVIAALIVFANEAHDFVEKLPRWMRRVTGKEAREEAPVESSVIHIPTAEEVADYGKASRPASGREMRRRLITAASAALFLICGIIAFTAQRRSGPSEGPIAREQPRQESPTQDEHVQVDVQAYADVTPVRPIGPDLELALLQLRLASLEFERPRAERDAQRVQFAIDEAQRILERLQAESTR
jgi:hypothetical protein